MGAPVFRDSYAEAVHRENRTEGIRNRVFYKTESDV